MANIMDLFSPTDIEDVKFDVDSIKKRYERVKNVQNVVGGEPRRLKAKVIPGGANGFEFSNGSTVKDFIVKSFQGIIVNHHRNNALFKSKIAEDETESMNTPPICSSTDGITGLIRETGECRECENCHYNMFGTDGKGKACKNMHRLYILAEGCPFPIMLSLPPTSLENWRNYVLMDIVAIGFDTTEVVTEFTLTSAVSEVGKRYSIVNFKRIGKVNSEVMEFCEGVRKSIEQSPRLAIEADEYNREAPEIIQQDDEDIPEEIASDLGSGLDEIIESEDEPEEVDFDSL